MSILKAIVSSVKATAAKTKDMLNNNKPLDSNEGKRLQKAMLIYLGSQTVDANLHPISRMYAGTLLPFVVRGMTPRKAVLCSLAGTAWMFSKNKKAGLIKSMCMTTIAISSVKPSVSEQVSEALQNAQKDFVDKECVVIQTEGSFEVTLKDGSVFTMPNHTLKYNALTLPVSSSLVSSLLDGTLPSKAPALVQLKVIAESYMK